MAGKKVVIVGGVAGGASCAARLRRLDETAQIVMFEKGPHISFANCGLPYHIGGVIPEREDLLILTPQQFKTRFQVDVRVETLVTGINREKREVEVAAASGRTYTEGYDYLVLAPGAEPIRPPVPGIDLPGIYTLRSIRDMDEIMRSVTEARPRTALVIGGGYIGLEIAENLRLRELEVAIVEKLPQVMAPLDGEMANIVHEHLHFKGIATWLGDGLSSFARTNNGLITRLESGQVIAADLVILAIGVRPDTSLAVKAALDTGTTGGIQVEDHMRTSDERIYAAGDAVEVRHLVTGLPALIPLAGPANRQGRIIADNIAGRDVTYKGTQGTSIVRVFDLTAATTGLNEKSLKRLNIPYAKVYIHPSDHAGYYPGSHQMAIKVLFRKEDGRLLGAQIVGPNGVDKRIDCLAIAMRAGLTVYDLEDQELAYAPPYGSAKDPINMIGFAASNILKGDVNAASWDEIAFPLPKAVTLVDVRGKPEWDKGHVPGAVNIPLDQLRSKLGDLPKDKEVLAYCGVGLRSYIAHRILKQHGFRSRNVMGGYRSFRAFHPELAKGDPRDIFAELKEVFCSIPTRAAGQAEQNRG
jgi:NADPH-dependent 2,4-dienoyl-CoA reductase/sulfur reductase-like enzyme/rhodanese-related sulfurtransferase